MLCVLSARNETRQRRGLRLNERSTGALFLVCFPKPEHLDKI